ncbi:hypothetical protein [Vibrio penaeicida]|uniref:Uncharacterized protein n=1 Tax=Vibrio penaeicida TaxID=104609 RepID=A0AAV5NUY8_9VIBR|nr:hypothetical protein [Vibrio penaeicida]GLQ74338.1 hypothetical protein GCM10007932_36990 [Vibrio penaeicida]
MKLRQSYPIQEAIRDLETIFDKTVTDADFRKELQIILDLSKKSGRLPFRSIFEKFIAQRKKNQFYSDLPDEDKEIIEDLFHFWG